MIDESFPVWVCHRDALVHSGLVATLLRHDTFAVHPAATVEELSAHLVQTRGKGVAVVDYESGLALLQACRHAAVSGAPVLPAVLIVSWRHTEAEIRRALEAGARGYLTGDCGLGDLVDAVRALRRGGRYLGEAAAHAVAESLTRVRLTARETDVLRLMAIGCPNKTIAARLDIAIGTVKAHTKAILAKLDAGSRTEAAVIAKQRGLLVPACSPSPASLTVKPSRLERREPSEFARVTALAA